MRGHYAVGFRRVGNREERGEGSARGWRALCERENHECQFFIGNREEKAVRGWRAWARPHGRAAVRPFE